MSVHYTLPILHIVDLSVFIKMFQRCIWVSVMQSLVHRDLVYTDLVQKCLTACSLLALTSVASAKSCSLTFPWCQRCFYFWSALRNLCKSFDPSVCASVFNQCLWMHQFLLHLLCPCVPLTFLGRLMDVFLSIRKWIVIYAKIIYFCNISAKMHYSGWLVSTLLWNVHAHKILHRTFDILPTFICYHITITSYFKLISTKLMYKQSCLVLRTWCI